MTERKTWLQEVTIPSLRKTTCSRCWFSRGDSPSGPTSPGPWPTNTNSPVAPENNAENATITTSTTASSTVPGRSRNRKPSWICRTTWATIGQKYPGLWQAGTRCATQIVELREEQVLLYSAEGSEDFEFGHKTAPEEIQGVVSGDDIQNSGCL